MRRIHVSDVEGRPALCYDTGLNPRSFARTKMSQNSLIEPGYVVFPDGTNKTWKATGVSEVNGLMRVWGEPFYGERLDGILNEVNSIQKRATSQQAALQAIVFWIRAKLLLGDVNSSLNPGAAFISFNDDNSTEPKGSVFFGPKNLSQRSLLVEGIELDSYNCPDLDGMEAAAFCAGVMLYKLLGQSHPYTSKADIFQDMRRRFPASASCNSGFERKLKPLDPLSSSFACCEKKNGRKRGGHSWRYFKNSYAQRRRNRECFFAVWSCV